MNCWDILETQPTSDHRAIKKAYTRLLRKFSPESDPQGFQNLRAAYEEALFFSRFNLAYPAAQESAPAPVGNPESETPLLPGDPDSAAPAIGLNSGAGTGADPVDEQPVPGLAYPMAEDSPARNPALSAEELQALEDLMARVVRDFPNHDLRQSEEYWRGLADSELFWNLSAKPLLGMRLFQFLGERYLEFKEHYTNAHVPRESWKLLDQAFGWLENERDYYACFPEDLANAVLDRIRAARDMAMSTDLQGEYRATRGLLVDEGAGSAGNYRWLLYLGWIVGMAALHGVFRCS